MKAVISLCNGHGAKYLHYTNIKCVYITDTHIHVSLGDKWGFDSYYNKYYAKHGKPSQEETCKNFNKSVQPIFHLFDSKEAKLVEASI